MLSTVNKLRGKIPPANANSNIDADKFNNYFASISNSSNYIEPTHKLSAPHIINYIKSSTVYYILNKSCPKGTGSHGLPGCFLKLISPSICEPLLTIYNNCIKQAFFPAQWKNSIIHPIKKINNPTQTNQYRPISITPILFRILEKYIVEDHIYPCLTNPLIKSRFDDRFAFRPTGSPTSAMIYLISVITSLLSSNKFVRLIALAFSKAFDTLNHSTLIAHMASLQLDDSIHNSLIPFFKNRTHSTTFLSKTSSALSINSSVVQGSVLGPSSFIINATSLNLYILSIK